MNKVNKTRPEPEEALQHLAAQDRARAEQSAAAMQQRMQAVVAVEWQRALRRRFVCRVGSAAASLVAMVGVGWLLFSQFIGTPPLAKQGESLPHPRVAKARAIAPVVRTAGAGSMDSLPGGAAPAAFTLRPESAPISPQSDKATWGGKNLPCVAIQGIAPDSTLSADREEKEEETEGTKKEAEPQPRP